MQGLNSLNQFLKISNYLKTYSTSIPEAKVSHSPPELPSGCVKGQQLQQHRIQFPQRQMENVLGKCQFVTNNEIKKKKCNSCGGSDSKEPAYNARDPDP